MDRAALADGASEIGIGSTLLDSFAESAKLSSGTRWSVALFAPGAVVVALGVQVIHLGTVLFVAERIERASERYGSLGVSFTILVWLYVVSRVIVASAMLNASLWDRRGASAA